MVFWFSYSWLGLFNLNWKYVQVGWQTQRVQQDASTQNTGRERQRGRRLVSQTHWRGKDCRGDKQPNIQTDP